MRSYVLPRHRSDLHILLPDPIHKAQLLHHQRQLEVNPRHQPRAADAVALAGAARMGVAELVVTAGRLPARLFLFTNQASRRGAATRWTFKCPPRRGAATR